MSIEAGVDWPARLASGQRISERVAIVVAHPDDETLWTGALLSRLDDAILIHVTDGAPADMHDAARLGFATRAAYGAARTDELGRALAHLGYAGGRRTYGVRDKEVVHALAPVTRRLRVDLEGAAVIVTHPYEGGHPDHDACALAVSRAAQVPVVEFACYAEQDGDRQFGLFRPATPEHTRVLTLAEAGRIDAALGAHASQAGVFGSWRPTHERWRAAPAHDFTRPPPGPALYDRFGWELTSARWCEIASRELVPC